jgi:hypothetical protein
MQFQDSGDRFLAFDLLLEQPECQSERLNQIVLIQKKLSSYSREEKRWSDRWCKEDVWHQKVVKESQDRNRSWRILHEPRRAVKSSGADDPAAMKVAPATSSDRWSLCVMTLQRQKHKSSYLVISKLVNKSKETSQKEGSDLIWFHVNWLRVICEEDSYHCALFQWWQEVIVANDCEAIEHVTDCEDVNQNKAILSESLTKDIRWEFEISRHLTWDVLLWGN